jgi:hypothetical protein
MELPPALQWEWAPVRPALVPVACAAGEDGRVACEGQARSAECVASGARASADRDGGAIRCVPRGARCDSHDGAALADVLPVAAVRLRRVSSAAAQLAAHAAGDRGAPGRGARRAGARQGRSGGEAA